MDDIKKRLIDAAAYEKTLDEVLQALYSEDGRKTAAVFAASVIVCKNLLGSQPTVETAQVVRCLDCKHRNSRGMCYMLSGGTNLVEVGDDFYCKYWERKSAEK